jgi:hypothetical protein
MKRSVSEMSDVGSIDTIKKAWRKLMKNEQESAARV